jgi:hypothetical protein
MWTVREPYRSLLHQQIERACERPRARAVAVADDGLAQSVYWAAMLYQRRGRDRRGTGVHIKGRPVLGDIPEYFSNAAVNEAPNPGRISDPVVLEAQELVLARHIRPPQFARRALPRLRLVEL